MSLQIQDDELHAYVDGLLDPERRRAVEQHLKDDPDAAVRVQQYRQLNDDLHHAFDELLDAPIPERLAQSAQSRAASSQRWPVWAQAAVIAFLMLGAGMTGWWAKGAIDSLGPSTGPLLTLENRLARPAQVSYQVYTPEVLHPVEVDHRQEQHLVAWLSKRLAHPLNVPDLNELGYGLIGGRLLAADAGAAALFMYEDEQGQRLTLYVTRMTGQPQPTAFQHFQEQELGTFYWVDGNLGYALSARLDKEALMAAADRVYRQLNL